MKIVGDIRPEKPYQNLPMKISIRERIAIKRKEGHSEPYYARVTFWIPDTPYSKEPPKICMTIAQGKSFQDRKSVRFVFDSTTSIWVFLDEIQKFLERNEVVLTNMHTQANIEWRTAHRLFPEKPEEDKLDKSIVGKEVK